MALTKIITDNIDLSSDTTALKIPKGTTAERPAGTTGMIRENTDTGNVEVYNGSAWRALQQTGQDTGVVGINNFNSILYTGDSSNQIITGFNFKPDLIWIKRRSSPAEDSAIYDTVRGPNEQLSSDSNAKQVTNTAPNEGVKSFNNNGFTTGDNGGTNRSPYDYVSWGWKAGGNSNTFNIDSVGYATAVAAGMNIGTIIPTGGSVNTEAGFSIVQYTGNGSASQTYAHGLSNKPALIITKKTSGAQNWTVWHEDLTSDNYFLYLNTNAAEGDGVATAFNSGISTSLVGIGNSGLVNDSGQDYISYSWTSIPGYSLIGSYEGSGLATDTPKIYTGFLPAWLMVKRTDSAGDWNIVDNKRSPSNPRTIQLAANSSAAESAPGSLVDFNSDGFQIITTDTGWNAENGDYIFMCFAS